MTKNYLLLGGGGFIGTRLAQELSKNNNVFILDNKPKNDYFRMNEDIVFYQANFNGVTDFSPFLTNIDSVIHLICTSIPTIGVKNIESEVADNLFASFKLFESMKNCGVDEIIFASSGGTVYGEWRGEPFKEDSPLMPICKYGILKLTMEQYLRLYAYYDYFDYKILRMANPYGSKIRKNKKQGVIPVLVNSFFSNTPIEIWGDGEVVRDFIYIDDIASAILSILKYNGDEKIFNIGSGVGHSVNQVLEKIRVSLNQEGPQVIYSQDRKCDVRKNILDISRLAACTGWRPSVDLDAGINLCRNDILKRGKAVV